MTDDNRRVADYFVIAGLPPPDKRKLLDQYSLEVNLKPSHNQDPITDITVIFPGLGENVPDYFQLLEVTSTGLPADLNHGSFRAPEAFICFRRGRERPPLVDVGVLYSEKEKVMPDSQIVEFTPHGHLANVNNTTNSTTFLTYRRATELSPCNELVVMDISIIVASKGEVPPHSFMKVDKNLNKAMMGSDVYLCYKKSMNRPDLVSYQPGLLQRFPITNNPTFTVDDTVAAFCLPMGSNLECWPTGTTRKSAVHTTFVLTLQNAKKVYGSAITFYEEYDEDDLDEEQKAVLKLDNYARTTDRKVFSNKCICLLSQWPFFEAFGKFLFTLYKRQLMGPFDIPIERFVSHFLYDVPFPSPERPRILVQMSAHDTIALFQPQELPLPRSGANFRHLLTTLGPDNCLLLLLLALTEQKILIHSLRPAILTAVVEAVMQIIFPFYWQCPYILPLPLVMSDYLSAPLPFVIGLDSRFFDLYDQPADVNAVDLDTNTISLCEERRSLSAKLLPKHPSRKLRTRLEQLTEKCIQYKSLAQKLEVENDEAIDFDFKLRAKEIALELEIQEAFLHFMSGILGGYRSFLLPITRAPGVGVTDVDNLFDRASFLRSRDRNYQKFYDMLLKTQMFTKFIEDCSFMSDVNTGLAFFDECVERSQREEGCGRLLEVEGQTNDRTVFLLPPDASDLPKGAEYRYTRFENLNPALFKVPCEDGEDGGGVMNTPALSPPNGNMAVRTKQEVKLAVRLATKHVDSPLLWAKCLLGTCYSVWFIHLPSMVLANNGSIASLRQGYNLLERMRSLRLHPVEEICYRVMLQLCCEYNKPVLAVKILFEMKRCGVHPNAVTYGYYNKAVLESEWPHGIASSSQLLWHKLRNVLLAVWLFKAAGKSARARRRAQAKLNEAETASQVSQTSLESGMSRQSGDVGEDVDGGGMERAASGGSKESELEQPKSEDCRGSNGSHTSDVGYASMNEIVGEKEGEKEVEEEVEEKEKLSRMRSFSIVKPKGPLEDENGDQIDDTIVAPEEHQRTSVRQVWEDDKTESKSSSSDKKPVKYTDIRNKFPGLLNKTDRTGPVRNLFRQESGDSSGEQPKFYQSESSGSSSRGGSELRSLSDDTSALDLDKSASVSCDSLEHMDSLPDSPVKKGERGARLPTLEEVTPVEQEVPMLGGQDLDTPELNSLQKIDSGSNLMKTPVTQDDPLGALSSNNSPMVTPAKAATLPSGERLTLRSSSMSDVLREPFATPDKLSTPSMDLSRQMQRSSTMPLNGEVLEEEGMESPAGSSASLVGSISSLSGSAMKSLTGSRAANVGMKRGKALLNTAWSSLSPNAAANKQTKEALNSSLASLKGWSSSAATNLSRRYETLVQQSPARSLDPDAAGDEIDRVSQCSTDSRRASESVLSETVPDTWATLTEALWENLWGTQKSLNHLPQQTAQRAADITEQFESLYSRADSRKGDHPLAMLITMTTCTPCHSCKTPLYDEEIMAGWTAQDSNLNTKCVFCSRLTLPVLTVQVKDFRNVPRPEKPTLGASQQELREGQGSTRSLNGDSPPMTNGDTSPMTHPTITIPYISPIVLRKELESVLLKEGDECLTDPNCPDLHPHIFWNLIYDFHRIAVPSHLPGLVLKTPSLNKGLTPHASWEQADYNNVVIKTKWDNVRIYDENSTPLYLLWRKRNCQEEPTKMHPLMQSVIAGVKDNDLHQCVKSIVQDRQRKAEGRNGSIGSNSSTPSSSAINTPTSTSRMEEEARIIRSCYREALFLTLVSLGQDNIDLTAFDREYRRAFEKLPHKVVAQTESCDKPPGMQTLFCRKLFRDLEV